LSAEAALRLAEGVGASLTVDGSDLVLEAREMPPPELVDQLKRHKADIIALLRPPGWDAGDWRAYFDERAGIAEHDGGLSRHEAETNAFEACVVESITQHFQPSSTNRCAGCGGVDDQQAIIVPFGTAKSGHAWLHPDCWNDWHQQQRERAIIALASLGIEPQ